MGRKEERAPKDSGTDGEMILQVTGGRADFGLEVSVFVDAGAAKTGIGGAVVVFEI